jgi:hypothetical protein
VLDTLGVFLYTDLMTTLKKQVQLKIKKFDELMIKLKIKYLKDSVFYSELNKLDEKVQEISKLVDNNKD